MDLLHHAFGKAAAFVRVIRVDAIFLDNFFHKYR
jgi:hypothetical protein